MLYTINDVKQMTINDFGFSHLLPLAQSPTRLFSYGFLLLINAPTFTFPSRIKSSNGRLAGQV